MPDRAAEIEANIQHLRRYALALTRDRDAADDLVQDAVERALSRWALRRRDLPARPWLFAILRNLFLSGRRNAARAPGRSALDPDEIADAGGAAEANLTLRRVFEFLHTLPEEQMSAVLLVSVEGLTYEEAAAVMQAPVGTVMSRLSRARARLRRMDEAPPAAKLRSVK